jgi:glycerophosphoryl diester phosphodiesterase
VNGSRVRDSGSAPAPGRRPLAIAHRGDSADRPENTAIAFAAALAAGVDGIELDVRLSRDGVPFVAHDATLARFGGGARSVRAMTMAELRLADVGVWKAQAIARRSATRRVRILCFDAGVLAEVARVAPHLALVRNSERRPRDVPRWLAAQPRLDAACFDRRIVDAALVAACHAHGLQVFSWSANHAAAADRLRRLGVDGILSDRPGWLVAHLGS